MPIRTVALVNNEVYHICNKSIAGFKIFNDDIDYNRMMESISFYIVEKAPCAFSTYKLLKNVIFNPSKKNVDIIAYCLMPTHIHLVLKQNIDNGIKKFVGLISQGYSQYFNMRHARKGPLWEGRFKNILVKDDDQLLHLTRYIHLNPVTSFLVNDPGDWAYSSYNEYLGTCPVNERLCNFNDLLKIDPISYKRFVLDRVDYQRELAKIKKLVLED